MFTLKHKYLLAFLLVFFFLTFFSGIKTGFFRDWPPRIFAQNFRTDNEDNLGLPSGVGLSSPNFSLDGAIDVVGGDAAPTGGSGINVMHGYHFLDSSASLTITRIVAVPEKRFPRTNNNSTYFLLEILPANSTYNPSSVVWSNAGLIAGGANHQTDSHGVWNGTYTVTGLGPGNYDLYFTGYSHLKKKLSNVALSASNNQLNFTYDEATLNNMITAGTLLPTDPLYPLLAGDAGVAQDADSSCGSNMTNCMATGVFSGDEWGDDEVNSLDVSSVLNKLYFNDQPAIMKEDLDQNTEVNSIDMSMTLNNLYKNGDK